MSVSSISDRLLQYVQYLGVGLDSFAHNCGLTVKGLLNLKEGYSYIFRRISKAYPQLNIKWLIYGEGQMLCDPAINENECKKTHRAKTKSNSQTAIISERNSKPNLRAKKRKKSYPIRNRLSIFIKHLGITSYKFAESLNLSVPWNVLDHIDESVFANVLCEIICEKYPELNYDWLFSGKGEMLIFLCENQKSTETQMGQPNIDESSLKSVENKPKTSERSQIDWYTNSIGYQWAIKEVSNGRSRNEIAAEFNKRHQSKPEDYSTSTGKPLTAAILCGWIKKAGVTPPVLDKPYPNKKQEEISQITSTNQLEKTADNQKNEENETNASNVEKNDLPISQAQSITHSQSKVKPSKKIDWGTIFKGAVMVFGAIGVIFLAVYIIAEFVLPTIFLVLIFLSMLFAKK